MKNVLKRLCMIIVVVMAVSLIFAGCTNIDKAADATDKPGSTAAGTETAKPDRVTINWYTGNAQGHQTDLPLIEQALNEYVDDKLNVSVRLYQFPWGEYNNRMRVIISSGGDVDLFFSCGWAMNYLEMAKGGWVVDITDMIDEYAPNAKRVLEGAFIEGPKVDGRLYHLACNKEKGANAGVLFKKELLDKYNLDINDINKYEDIIPWLEIIKANEPDILPIATSKADNSGILGQYYNEISNLRLGGFNPAAPGKHEEASYRLDVPEVREIFYTAKQIADMGFVRGDAVTINDKWPDLNAGRVFCWHEQLKPGKDDEVSLTTNVEWVQRVISPTHSRNADLSGSMMAISTASKNPERVLQFYDMFYHDKYLVNLLNWGIEDLHYVKAGENSIDWAPGTEGGTKSGWNPGVSWTIGDQFLNYLFVNEDPQKWEKYKEFNSNCYAYESLGFIFDTEPVAEIVSRVNTVELTEYTLLTLGLVDDVDETIEAIRDKMNAAGYQELLDECNRQYQEWLKTK